MLTGAHHFSDDDDMQGRTAKAGEKTAQHTQFSPLSVQNKDPNMDYSFRRRKDIDDGNGVDVYGYEPVSARNSNGEMFGIVPHKTRTRGKGQLVHHDVILCKRPKELSKIIKIEEDEKYNAQVRLLQNSMKKAKTALRELDPDSSFVESIKSGGPGMTQRQGPTEEQDG